MSDQGVRSIRDLKVRLLFIAAITVGIVGCSENNEPIESSVQAPPKIQDSFGATQKAGVEGTFVTLTKTSLEKEFLLQASLIQQAPVPQFENLKSRIVAFRKIDGTLFMLEATQGHVLNNETSRRLILAQFPIVAENNAVITFDFNAGMQSILFAGDWRASDFEGSTYDPNKEFAGVYHASSFIEEAKTDKSGNRFVIRQIAQIPSIGNVSAEIKYYLEPYLPPSTSQFSPTPSKGFDRLGFFEVAPQMMADGNTKIFATKFNNKKKITYAVSADTPPEYRQAIKDAILYWNRTGAVEVEAIDAPSGVSAPDVDYNIIQWVKWDQAGMAYADAQMDPRTGEVRHAQVFLTSVFGFSGKERALQLLRKLRSNPQDPSTPQPKVGLRGLMKGAMCMQDLSAQISGILNQALSTNASDEMILKMSQDYIREVVAHEVGHTLGLRHNFAGSLASNYSLQDRSALIKTYMETQHAPTGVVASSTVMDYNFFEESAWIGDLIGTGKPALDYDLKALQTLYLGKKFANKDLPLFCTDSHADVEGYVDCQRFDFGKSMPEFVKYWVPTALTEEPNVLLETFISAKLPTPGLEPIDFNEIKLSLADRVAKILDARSGARTLMMKALTDKARVLRARRSFSRVDATNEEQVHRAELDEVYSEVMEQGGLEEVLSMIPDDFAQVAMAKFNQLLEDPNYFKGFGTEGRSFEWSSAEIETMKIIAQNYFDKLEYALIKKDLEILTNGIVEDHPIAFELAKVLGNRETKYAFTNAQKAPLTFEYQTEEENVVDGEKVKTKKTVSVLLPQFQYPNDIRMLAAKLVSPARAKSIASIIPAASAYRIEALLLMMKLSEVSMPMQTALRTRSAEELTQIKEQADWFLTNSAMMYSLFQP